MKKKIRFKMKVVLYSIILIGTCLAEPQLQLVNVVFRHGDRTPVIEAMFPTDPHINSCFYPMGHGGLTNAGKYRAYHLGEFLRARYRDWLGEIYSPKLLFARSTDYDRTKMSLQLVLAALFPPSDIQKWHNVLDWQPIPFTIVPSHLDDVLGVTAQPSFAAEKERVRKTEFVQRRLKHFEEFISRLENLTGKKIPDTYAITKVYDTFYAESNMNLTLPSWSVDMFPDGELREAALIDYELMTYDKNMTYELGGKLAAKIRDDILAATNKTESNDKKLLLYSGHEVNVVGALKSLQVYKLNMGIPTYTSAAIVELYEEKDKNYVKVLYYHGDSSEAEEMTIPGCTVLCPLEKYLDVVNELLS